MRACGLKHDPHTLEAHSCFLVRMCSTHVQAYVKLKLCFDFIFKNLQWNDDDEQ